jgi:hypothetical protein
MRRWGNRPGALAQPGWRDAAAGGSLCRGAGVRREGAMADRPYVLWTTAELKAEYAKLSRRVAALHRQAQEGIDMMADLASELSLRGLEPSSCAATSPG